jgi:hypothetical protein
VATASGLVGTLRRLLAVALPCVLLTSCMALRQSRDDAVPAGAGGTAAWTGQGLVLAYCGASGMSSTTIELWEVDPVSGTQTGHRPPVEIPGDVGLAFPCDEPPALSRRLFNHDFTAVAVKIADPGSDATRIGTLDLTTGRVRTRSRPPDSAFAPLPHDDAAVYDDEGRSLWYRAGNSDTIVSYDPEAPSEQAWTDHGAVSDPGGGDAAAWFYANAGGLVDPSGRMVAVGDTLYAPGEDRRVRMFCTALFSGEDVTGDDCIASETAADGTPDVTPAAWLDDDTLLAFDGPRRAAATNTVVRLEFDDDFTSVTATPALPASDWLHRSLVAALPCGQFATFATRGDDLAIFVQDLDAGDTETPTLVTTFDTTASEAPDAPPGGARLVDWVPAPGEATTCLP